MSFYMQRQIIFLQQLGRTLRIKIKLLGPYMVIKIMSSTLWDAKMSTLKRQSAWRLSKDSNIGFGHDNGFC